MTRALAGLVALLVGVVLTGKAVAHGGEVHDAPAIVDEYRLMPGWNALDFEAPTPGSYELPRIGRAADGAVLDTDGIEQSLHGLFAGRVTVLAFIYTRCGDVDGCPFATAVMRRVASRVNRDADLAGRVRFVSMSFDPEFDTPTQLALHSAAFVPEGSDWRFVTSASTEQLAPVLRAYGQSVTSIENAQGHTELSHILRVFLIDGEGEIRNIYSTSFLHAASVVSDLRTLLDVPASEQANAALSSTNADAAYGLRLARQPQLGLPDLDAAHTRSLSEARIDLGAKLFFDRRLSHNGTLSCGMCHVPAQAFASNELATAVGIEGATVKRNTPTLLNVGHLDVLFHDGGEYDLAQQIWNPLLARNEMANVSVGAVLARIRALPDYAGRFEAAFDGQSADMLNVGEALAAYQRSLRAGDSPFDRWHYGGDDSAMSDAARDGFALFTGKAGCARCHTVGARSALFSDQRFHDTGIGYARSMTREPERRRVRLAPGVYADVDLDLVRAASAPRPNDLGRYEVTTDPADRWHYRTAPLRNVALTAPYMHDGSLATLEDVVEHYDAGGPQTSRVRADSRTDIEPLGLDAGERAALVAFLESLTSPHVARIASAAGNTE